MTKTKKSTASVQTTGDAQESSGKTQTLQLASGQGVQVEEEVLSEILALREAAKSYLADLQETRALLGQAMVEIERLRRAGDA